MCCSHVYSPWPGISYIAIDLRTSSLHLLELSVRGFSLHSPPRVLPKVTSSAASLCYLGISHVHEQSTLQLVDSHLLYLMLVDRAKMKERVHVFDPRPGLLFCSALAVCTSECQTNLIPGEIVAVIWSSQNYEMLKCLN